MKVKNQKTIRRLSFRIFGANRTRNLVAVLAIALQSAAVLCQSAAFSAGNTGSIS